MSTNSRRFSFEFKLRVVSEVLEGRSKVSVSNAYGIHVNTITKWVNTYRSIPFYNQQPTKLHKITEYEQEIQQLNTQIKTLGLAIAALSNK